MMKNEKDTFICCFCGVPIKPQQDDPVEIAVTVSDGGMQGLRAHAKCLRQHLHKSVPLAIGETT